MKTKTCIVLGLFLIAASSACAGSAFSPGSSRSTADLRLYGLPDRVDALKEHLEELGNAHTNLLCVHNKLESAHDELLSAYTNFENKVSADIEQLRKENTALTEKLNKCSAANNNIWMWAVLTLFAAVVGFAVWPRKRLHQPSPESKPSTSLPTCPRCGQPHDPSDTVCSNPNCKTQF